MRPKPEIRAACEERARALAQKIGAAAWYEVARDELTAEEAAQVAALWDKMPGSSCWTDAFFEWMRQVRSTADLRIGDEIEFTPHDRRHSRVLVGFVAEMIKNQDNEEGLEVLEDRVAEDRPITVAVPARLWLSDGTIVTTGKVADWQAQPTKPDTGAKPALAADPLPYRHPSALIRDYQRRGLDRQRAWNQFVRDTILQKVCRSEPWDAADFFKMFDNT